MSAAARTQALNIYLRPWLSVNLFCVEHGQKLVAQGLKYHLKKMARKPMSA